MFQVNKKRGGFTLVELLVVVSIVGVLGSVITTSTQSAIGKSQGAYEMRIATAVKKAFKLKGLDDNITTWWHEDDFPPSIGWGSYIDHIIEDELISEFLPIIPDETNYGGNTQQIPYAYDNDGDTFTDPADCFSNSNQGNSFRGVNFVYNLGLNQNDDKWWDIVNYMDEAIDKSDGPFCGTVRYALTGNAGSRGQIIFSIDNDQYPDF